MYLVNSSNVLKQYCLATRITALWLSGWWVDGFAQLQAGTIVNKITRKYEGNLYGGKKAPILRYLKTEQTELHVFDCMISKIID